MGIVVSDPTFLADVPGAMDGVVDSSTTDDGKNILAFVSKGKLYNQIYDENMVPVGDPALISTHVSAKHILFDSLNTTSAGGLLDSYTTTRDVDGQWVSTFHVLQFDADGKKISDYQEPDDNQRLLKLSDGSYIIFSENYGDADHNKFSVEFFNSAGEPVADKVLAKGAFTVMSLKTLADGKWSFYLDYNNTDKMVHMLLDATGNVLNSVVVRGNEMLDFGDDGGYVIHRDVFEAGGEYSIDSHYDSAGQLLGQITSPKYVTDSYIGSGSTFDLSSGEHVVFWTDFARGNNLHMRVVDDAGNLIVADQAIGGSDPLNGHPMMQELATGGWVVYWDGHQKIFNANGAEIGKSRVTIPEGNVTSISATSDGGWTYKYIVTDFDGSQQLFSKTFHTGRGNNAPVAITSYASLFEDTVLTFDHKDFRVYDYDGDSVTSIIIETLPDVGTLRLGDADVHAGDTIAASDLRRLTWTPPTNFNGDTASLTFRAVDENGAIGSQPARFDFHVVPVDDDPVGRNTTITITEDEAARLNVDDFPFVDVEGDKITAIRLVAESGGGQMRVGDIGVVGQQILNARLYGARPDKIIFTPTANESGHAYATFRFKLMDDYSNPVGGRINETWHTLTINVLPVNDAPHGEAASIWINDGDHVDFFDQFFRISDIEKNKLKSIIIDTLPDSGRLKLDGHAVKVGEEISVTDIDKISFDLKKGETESHAVDFTFSVRDNGGTAHGGVDIAKSATTFTFKISDNHPVVHGTFAKDHLDGGSADDILMGGAGHDVLDGGSGNDTLIGGTGSDVLIGGQGSDVFVMDQTVGLDKVKDFDLSTDKIDVRWMQLTTVEELEQHVYVDAADKIVEVAYQIDGKHWDIMKLTGVDVSLLSLDNFIM